MSELIAPIVLIITLFAVNAVVLFLIFRYRRRKENKPVYDEELKTFTITNDGDQSA